MNDNRAERPKPTWTIVKEFTDTSPDNTAGAIAVRVSKSDTWRPLYTVSVGYLSNDSRQHDRLGTFMKVRANGQGKIEIVRISNLVAALIKQAEDWILLQLQSWEDERIESLEKKERYQLEKEKPKQRPGLKTLGKL